MVVLVSRCIHAPTSGDYVANINVCARCTWCLFRSRSAVHGSNGSPLHRRSSLPPKHQRPFKRRSRMDGINHILYFLFHTIVNNRLYLWSIQAKAGPPRPKGSTKIQGLYQHPKAHSTTRHMQQLQYTGPNPKVPDASWLSTRQLQ